MNKALKILLWIGGLIIAIPVGLIALGAIAAILGLNDPAPPPPEQVETQTSVVEIEKPQPKISVEVPPQNTGTPLVLPEGLTAQEASRWVVESRLVYSRGDAIFVNFDVFKRLSIKDALTLHSLFRKAEHAEDIKSSTQETEQLKRQYYMMHLLVFAGGSAFEPDARLEFAEKSGAIFQTSFFHNVTPRGDYINLFDWHKRDTSGSVETAIREYAKVFGDKEMITTLKNIGAIEVLDTRSNPNHSSRWRIRAGEKLAQFKPETLQVIHDAIKKTFGGDRVKLRREIRKLIETRHTSDDLPHKE